MSHTDNFYGTATPPLAHPPAHPPARQERTGDAPRRGAKKKPPTLSGGRLGLLLAVDFLEGCPCCDGFQKVVGRFLFLLKQCDLDFSEFDYSFW